MNIMCIFAVVFACIGLTGLIMSMIGVGKQNFSLCQYATWFSSAASGFLIGLGISMVFGWVHIVSPDEYKKINKPAEKVYVNRCWTSGDKPEDIPDDEAGMIKYYETHGLLK